MLLDNFLMKCLLKMPGCGNLVFWYSAGVLANICKVFSSAFIQLLGPRFHPLHYLFIRYTGQSLLCIIQVLVAQESVQISGPQLGWSLLIVSSILVYVFGLFFALQLIPVGDATCLHLSSLLIALCPLSRIISGTSVGVVKLLAVAVCTTGIVFIWQPWAYGSQCKYSRRHRSSVVL